MSAAEQFDEYARPAWWPTAEAKWHADAGCAHHYVDGELAGCRLESQKSADGIPSESFGADGPCDSCGVTYPAWFAPHRVWNRVQGGDGTRDDPGGLLCPLCFLWKASANGVTPLWHIGPWVGGLADESRFLPGVTP